MKEGRTEEGKEEGRRGKDWRKGGKNPPPFKNRAPSGHPPASIRHQNESCRVIFATSLVCGNCHGPKEATLHFVAPLCPPRL